MQVPPDEFMIPFFKEKGYLRKLCPSCGLQFWTLNPDAENYGDASYVDDIFLNKPPINKPCTMTKMRKKFLSFFKKKDHKRINSYSVIARWHDDLMFQMVSIFDLSLLFIHSPMKFLHYLYTQVRWFN